MPFPVAAEEEIKQQRIPKEGGFLGIWNNLPPDRIPAAAFADAENIIPGLGDKRPGNTHYLTTAAASAIQGLFAYARQSTSQRYLLWAANGTLYRDDSTSLRTGLHATNRYEFANFVDVAYFVDGSNGLMHWNGTAFGRIHPTNGVGSVVPAATAGNELNDSASKIHESKYLTVYKNHVCLAGAAGLPYRVYFSDLTQAATDNAPTLFKGADALDFQSPRGGVITGLVPTANALVVFKDDSIFSITGSGISTFVKNTITVEMGCPSGRTAKYVPGLGVVFQANDGHFYRLVGLEGSDAQFVIRRLSKHFSGDYGTGIAQLNMAKLSQNAAGVSGDLYWAAVCTGANTTPNKIFVMNHRKMGASPDGDPSAEFVPWSVYTHPTASCFETFNNGTSEFFLAGDASATGQIFKLDEGSNVDGAATAIDGWVLTPKLSFGKPERRKTLQYIHITFEGVSNSGATLTTQVYVDDKAPVTLSSLSIQGTPSLWGVMQWGVDVWGIRRANKTKRLAVNKTGQLFQFKFQQNTASVPLRLFELLSSFTYSTEI